MSDWRKWVWPGVVAVVVLTVAAVWMKAETIEQDLSAKATENLQQEHSWASVELDGRDLTLKGVAPTQEASNIAVGLVDEAYDVRVIMRETTLLAEAKPYKFAASKSGNTITLTGNVPDENIRADVLEAAKKQAPETEIVDQMVLGRGAPKIYNKMPEFALLQLVEMDEGSISFTDMDLEVSGTASGFDEYDKILRNMKRKKPKGTNVTSETITPPTVTPYEWSAEYDGEAVVLDGYAPTQEAKRQVANDIKEQLPDVRVRNNLRIAAGAPDGYDAGTKYASTFFGNLTQGKVALSDNKLSVEGRAKSVSDFTTARDGLGKLPQGFDLATNNIGTSEISPYKWSAEKSADSITLSGFMPTQDERDALVETTGSKFPDAKLVNELQLASGNHENHTATTEYALTAISRFSVGSAKLSDNDLTLTGSAKTAEDYEALNEMLAAGPEGINVSGDFTLPKASPYRWSVSKTNAGTTVRGNAPSRSSADAANAMAAKATGVSEVTDKQTLASGEPADFDAVRSLVASQVAQLVSGQGVILDQQVLISGRANEESTVKQIENELIDNLPESYVSSTNLILPKPEPEPEPEPEPNASPYRWSVSKTDAGITVRGNASSRASADAAVAMVAETTNASQVTDKQSLASGEPADFDSVRSLVAGQVTELVSGQGAILDNQVLISGLANEEANVTQIEKNLNDNLPEGWSSSTNIILPKPEPAPEPAPAPAPEPEATTSSEPKPDPKPEPVEDAKLVCQRKITEAINDRQIFFDTNRASIKAESNVVLDAIARAALDCPEVGIEIGGHTDARGSDSFNQNLSQARANSVRSYLVSKGMKAEILKAIGFGEKNPIADNSNRDGRAKNRRIEFTVTD